MDMNKTVHILLAEDDQIDEKAFLRAIERLRITNPITVARDGLEAWEILKGLNGRAPLPRPNLLVLDINMPRMNGLELLRAMRADPALQPTPVVILTTSGDDRDRVEAYRLNAAGYMLKPVTAAAFFELMVALERYWNLVELP